MIKKKLYSKFLPYFFVSVYIWVEERKFWAEIKNILHKRKHEHNSWTPRTFSIGQFMYILLNLYIDDKLSLLY